MADLKIGDEVYIHGFIDEVRRDTVIIKNEGGYFGTVSDEIMPSAQPEPKWIPVTKKAHPDLPIRVQVQMNNGWIITAYYQEGEWLSVPDCGEPLLYNWIEAWRELPEPWRGEEHGTTI